MKKNVFISNILRIFVFLGLAFPFVSFASCVEPQGTTLDDLFSSKELALGLYKKGVKDGKTSYELYLGNGFAPFSIENTFCQSEFSQLDGKNEGYLFLAQKKDGSAHYLQAIQDKNSAVERFTEASNMYEGIQSGSIQHVNLREDIFYQKPDVTLRPGMEGEEVKKLQQALKVKLGLDESFKIDGKYGPATAQAVKRLQQIIGIKEDGIAGDKTLSALVGVVIGTHNVEGQTGVNGEQGENGAQTIQGEGISSVDIALPQPTLRPGMEGEEVKKLQHALKEWLHLDESFKIDGKYGPMTTNAVRQLQRNLSLGDDGVFGPKTYAAFLQKLRENSPQGESQAQQTAAATDGETSQQEQEGNAQQQGEAQGDTIAALNRELKALLLRAKNELLSLQGTKEGIYSSITAYEKVIKYNNDILHTSQDADPLYVSLDGGNSFVYTLKLPDGKYACVDGNAERELKELDERPAGQTATGCE